MFVYFVGIVVLVEGKLYIADMILGVEINDGKVSV